MNRPSSKKKCVSRPIKFQAQAVYIVIKFKPAIAAIANQFYNNSDAMNLQRRFGVMHSARTFRTTEECNQTAEQSATMRWAVSRNISASNLHCCIGIQSGVQEQRDPRMDKPTAKARGPMSVDIEWISGTELSNPLDGSSKNKKLTNIGEADHVLKSSNEPEEEKREDKPRRVSFRVDASGALLCHVSLRSFPLTAQDIKDFWWSRDELKASRADDRALIRHVAKFNPAYKEAAHQLLSKFAGMIPLSQETSRRHGQKRTDEEAVALLGLCDARGLEKPLLPLMRIPRSGKAGVSRLLERQTQLARDGCGSASERAERLARQYHQDSRQAAVWARLLADGDEMAARTNQRCNV